MPSLLEALEKKYFSDAPLENTTIDVEFDGDDMAGEEHGSGNGSSSSGSAPHSSGFLSIGVYIPPLPALLLVPEVLVLNDYDIDCAGDVENHTDRCKRVRELDLAQNKLNDWQEVFHILRHMPRVEFLNLSKNELMGPISKLHAPSISNLRSMVLNETYLDWLCMDVLLDNLPQLEELHLSLNNYNEVLIDTADVDADADVEAGESSPECATAATDCSQPGCGGVGSGSAKCKTRRRCKRVQPHCALKTLHFTGNPIESWHEICRLGRVFPSLENLVLADCPIKSLRLAAPEGDRATTVNANANAPPATPPEPVAVADADAAPYKHFPNLHFLNLSYANVSSWSDIDQLTMFPQLRKLRIKHLPLWDSLECTEHERRQLLIARLPNVCILNGGGIISADEREVSERAFIRHYMEKPECERPERYTQLVAKHGQLDPLVNVSLKPDKRVKVIITYGERSEPRLVDIHCTVGDFKVKLQKIIELPANRMRLYYVDKDFKEHGPEEMRFPKKLLYSYNIHAGDEIIVDEKR